jgi:2,3-dihydroxybenzoate-AMP ligase
MTMLAGCTPWPAETADAYRERGWWRGESLPGLLRSWAEQFGEATALVDERSRLSYADLDRRVDRMAGGFAEAGVRPGDRIVVQLPNVAEFVIVVFALLRAGAMPVFCLISHRSAEVRHLCEVSGAVGYVAPDSYGGFDHLALGAQLLEEQRDLRWMFVYGDSPDTRAAGMVSLSAIDAAAPPSPSEDAGDVAFFLLSGGTTAAPKLIPRTHDDYAYQLRETVELCSIGADDVYLAALPVEFNFTWGCPGVLGTLAAGGTVILAADPTPDTCFELIASEGVTVTSLVPTVARLWTEAVEWSEADLSSLRLVQIGGAKLHPALAARIEPALGCRLQQVYGMAEGLLCMSRPDDDEQAVLETQGRPLSAGDEVRIAGDDDRDVAEGETGQLLVRGPYTLRGYYNAPEHNGRAFTEDGFYRSGDLARMTASGDVVVEGRVKDIVIRGGNKIAAGEIEGHLLELAGVAAAAVVPVPDDYLGERICAFLVCPDEDETPSLPQLKQSLHDRGLADFKLPDRLEIVESFPLTPLRKIDKKALAAAAVDANERTS